VASDVPLRSTRLPSGQQVIELLAPEFARAGYDVEDVLVRETLKPPHIVVVADGENGLDLDAVAELSRSASELLDRFEESTGELAPYVLEVTSPGVDRPLTADRHFRRAQGRVVEMTLSDGSQLTGRLGVLGEGILRLVVAEGPGKYSVREIPRDAVAKAVVQVEFSPPNRRELELAGGQERSDPGSDAGGQERSDKGIDAGGQERSDKGIGTGQSGKEAEA
jgi:ribosome maturation factor RimP